MGKPILVKYFVRAVGTWRVDGVGGFTEGVGGVVLWSLKVEIWGC